MLCYPVRVAMLWQWVGNPDSPSGLPILGLTSPLKMAGPAKIRDG